MVRTPRNNHTHTYYDVNSSVGKMPDHLQRSGSAGTSLLGGFPEQGENVSEVSEADSREWTWEDDEEQACGEDVLQDTTARSHVRNVSLQRTAGIHLNIGWLVN